MTRTIPNRLPKNHPIGDYQARCDICGSMWYRSKLRRKEGGALACPKDFTGRDEAERSRLNAQDAPTAQNYQPTYEGGSSDTRTLPVIVRRTAADILRYDK